MSFPRSIRSGALAGLAVAGGLLLAGPARAVDLADKFSIHAYGGWAAGRSDPYPYLTGDGEPDFEVDNARAVLLMQFRPVDEVTIVIAPEWEIEQEDGSTEQDQNLEIASVEWSTSEKLRLRLGRNRMPFGNYTDIFDVGTLRPFYSLPQSIYGSTGFVTESYNGVGISGLVPAGGWEVDYDLYAGGGDFLVDVPFEQALEEIAADEPADKIKRLLGGRVTFGTPVEGLRFGLSAYAGRLEGADAPRDHWGDFASYGTHLEFDRSPWLVRGEVARHREDLFDTDAGYLEVACRFGTHWQGAVRADRVRTEFVEELPASFDSLLKHDELSLGASYWFNENLVLRASYHRVDGNLFAHPSGEQLFDEVDDDAVDERTDLFQFGVQFSF